MPLLAITECLGRYPKRKCAIEGNELPQAANRVVGVLDRWEPTPKFYDLNNNKYGKPEAAFIPFTRAIDQKLVTWGNNNCSGDPGEPGWEGRLHSECIWLQFWVELPTAADVAKVHHALKS